jgi:hypothetical protein
MKTLFTALTIAGVTFAGSVGGEVLSILHTINQIGVR